MTSPPSILLGTAHTKGPSNKSRGPVLPVPISRVPQLAALFLRGLLGSGFLCRLLGLGRFFRGFLRGFFRRLLGSSFLRSRLRGRLRGHLRGHLFRRLFLALFVGFFFDHEDFFFLLGNALAVPA